MVNGPVLQIFARRYCVRIMSVRTLFSPGVNATTLVLTGASPRRRKRRLPRDIFSQKKHGRSWLLLAINIPGGSRACLGRGAAPPLGFFFRRNSAAVRIKRVAQPVTKEVEGKNHHDDRQHGDGGPGIDLDRRQVLRIIQHDPPADGRSAQPEAQK